MGAKKLEKFGGMLPAWDANLTPEGQAVNASNCYLFSGALQGWRQPSLLRQLTNGAAKYAYRLPTNTQAVAYAFLMFITQPNVGDTVTVGDFTYTFLASVDNTITGYYVAIGGNVVATATNLLNAITADNGNLTNSGVTYGNNVQPNPLVLTLMNQFGVVNAVLPITNVGVCMQIYAADYGAQFNSIVVSSSNHGALLWLSDTNSQSHTTNTFVNGANPTTSSLITSSSQFLEFTDPDTNVVKSQVAADAYERYYFASPSQAPQYNTRRRINAGLPAFLLGVPAPLVAPAISVIGGGDQGTLGPTGSNGGLVSVGANTVYLIPIIPAGSFLLNDVSWVPNETNANLNWATVVYEDSNPAGNVPTSPGALCNVSPQQTGTFASSTMTGTFANPCTTIPGTVYWIGIMLDTTITVEEGDSANTSVVFNNTFTNGPPANAPTVTTGQADLVMWADITSTAVQESRSYVYTYISAYGEEGPPSPFTLVNGWGNGTWNLQLTIPPPNDLGVLRNLAVIRIYRTITSDAGLTTYFQVVDLAIGSSDPDAINYVNLDGAVPSNIGVVPGYGAAYADTVDDSTVALNLELPSANFYPPPVNLTGILNLPNGVIAGFRNQEVWFCEPYLPHAWPFGYMQMCDYPVVGLGHTSGAVVAATTAIPFVFQGLTPGQMTVFKCPSPAPCISRGSIVSLEEGVIFSSPNGLIQVPNSGQLQNLSETWIKREDWARLTPLKNLRAVFLGGLYYAWGTTNGSDVSVAQQGFNLELDTDISSFGVWPQPGGHRIGFMPLTSPIGNIDNVFNDPWSGQTCFIAGGNIYFLDFTNTNYTMQPYDFLTKKYREVAKKNFSAMRIFFTLPPNAPPVNNLARNTAAPFDPSWNTLQPNQLAIIKVWADVTGNQGADGTMFCVMARELVRNGQIMRIPDGFKAENWQLEVLGQVIISNIQFATSVQELGEV